VKASIIIGHKSLLLKNGHITTAFTLVKVSLEQHDKCYSYTVS